MMKRGRHRHEDGTDWTNAGWYNRMEMPYMRTSRYYTEEERRDIVEMIDEGWHPLDVAVAFGMRITRNKDSKKTGMGGGCTSGVHDIYWRWAPKYSKLFGL